METEDKHHVAIVFERINRFGTQLDTFQLLSAWVGVQILTYKMSSHNLPKK